MENSIWYDNIEPTKYDTNAYKEVLHLINRNEGEMQANDVKHNDHKVNSFFVVQDALIRGEWLIPDHFFHDGGQGGGQAVLVLPAQAGGKVALGVCVNEQHLFPQTG